MSQVGRIVTAFAVLVLLAVPQLAAAQTRMAPTGFFAEGLFSGNFSDLDDLTFINPIGAGATLSQRSGDRIILENVEEGDFSPGVKAAAGYQFANNVLVRGAYSYISQVEAEGFARFAGGNFRQDLEVDAHAVMAEVGYTFPLTERMFVEGSLGAGFAVVDAKGFQGKNLGRSNYFPSRTSVNPAFNGGLGAGYWFADRWSVMLATDYMYLGEASTDRTKGTEGNINPSEQLLADLYVWRVMLGLRHRF